MALARPVARWQACEVDAEIPQSAGIADTLRLRFFALLIGKDGYARSLHEAISARIVLTKTCNSTFR